jgi:hypothetical protein
MVASISAVSPTLASAVSGATGVNPPPVPVNNGPPAPNPIVVPVQSPS